MIQSRPCLLLAASLLLATPVLAQQTNGVGLPNRGGRAPDGPVTPGQPLRTNAPTAPDQKPAFEGQVRAPAVVTATPISVEVKIM